MLDSKQMYEQGYSGAFRACFDFLARYADTGNDPTAWDRCCMEAVEISKRYENGALMPLVNGLLGAIFAELAEVYSAPREIKPPTARQPEEPAAPYRFKL